MHTFEKSLNCIDTKSQKANIGTLVKRMPITAVKTVAGELRFWANTLLVWQQRASQRRHLASLDHRLLRDMGMTRADADREAAKPFWEA